MLSGDVNASMFVRLPSSPLPPFIDVSNCWNRCSVVNTVGAIVRCFPGARVVVEQVVDATDGFVGGRPPLPMVESLTGFDIRPVTVRGGMSVVWCCRR